MRTYEANMTIFRKGWDGMDLSPLCEFFDFEAASSYAKIVLLNEYRKRISQLENREGMSVLIFCVPVPETGNIADSAELIRSRHKFSSAGSIQTVSAEELFVEGYGPKVWEELSK